MKSTIERTLFWFTDGDDQLLPLLDKFSPLALLLNRLLSNKYNGKKIKFINLNFRTEETYRLYPQADKYYLSFYGGHFNYDDVFNLQFFRTLKEEKQKKFLWQRAYEIIREAALKLENVALLEAVEYAYQKGLEIGLNPDFKAVESNVVLNGNSFDAAVWMCFLSDRIVSKFTLARSETVFFEQMIDKAALGDDTFLEIYKKIESEGNTILIKGRRDIKYLPLRIPIEVHLINIKHS